MLDLVATRAARVARRAFTLIELMITVAIVGVLAVVAYASYHKFFSASHATEANNMLSGIKARQEAWLAQTGSYMNVSNGIANGGATGLGSSNFAVLYPHCVANTLPPGAFNVQWPVGACGTTCCPGGGDWKKLGVESTSPTFYGYTTIGVGPGSATAIPVFDLGHGSAILPAGTSASPWFVATAVGDSDANSIFSTLMISSFDNSIYVAMDGE
jgi:prepilin-type N-terminal cleavage/methylation domain-containing protein